MLLQVLTGSQLVVCFKAKDLLCTALQFYRDGLSWKQGGKHTWMYDMDGLACVCIGFGYFLFPVVGCDIHDPLVSDWLLDPANPSSCYQDLLNKHFGMPRALPAFGAKKVG